MHRILDLAIHETRSMLYFVEEEYRLLTM
nr:hypothetical protein [Paenibacillus anseongense]